MLRVLRTSDFEHLKGSTCRLIPEDLHDEDQYLLRAPFPGFRTWSQASLMNLSWEVGVAVSSDSRCSCPSAACCASLRA